MSIINRTITRGYPRDLASNRFTFTVTTGLCFVCCQSWATFEQVHRIASNAVDPTAKNYHWGDFTQGLIHAKQTGFDNTLLLDSAGHITEGPGFNVFMIKDGQVATPRSGVLEGITRKVSMEICTHHNLLVTERDITLAEFLGADEVFATTTGGGLVPITRVNQHRYSNDAPGETTLSLQATYWQWHEDSAMSEVIAY